VKSILKNNRNHTFNHISELNLPFDGEAMAEYKANVFEL
jgi:hypothetical protein